LAGSRTGRSLQAAAKDHPPRLLRFVLLTSAVGCPLAAGAAVLSLSSLPLGLRDTAGIAVFFVSTLLAELRPVPIDVDGKRLISLAFVFIVSSQLLFGWEWSVVLGTASIAAAQLPQRVGWLRLTFNSAVYAIAAALAALPDLVASTHGYARLTAVVFASGALFVLTNVTLVCVAIALSSGSRIRAVLVDHLRHSGPAFLIMAFIAAQAVIFWSLSPFLLALVSAPLFSLNLYQRSIVRSRAAQRDATTDSLTGLKNHRAYEAEVGELLATAGADARTMTLCLVDVDRFKQVNDRYGHPAGDAVLRVLGGLIEELAPGCGYRLGGDEFAVLVPAATAVGTRLMDDVQRRLSAVTPKLPDRVTVSSGIASFPDHAAEPGELKKRADLALYHSKRNGKGRSSVHEPEPEGERVESWLPDDPRLRAAERLVAAVDARDAYVGQHSIAVATLAEGMGRALAFDDETVARLRLAGLLHDLGKIAIPDGILRKPGPLDEAEIEIMRTHPGVAFELLGGLDLDPVDSWVLHHHEHWDGSGYPDGLAGVQIPFGSRLILVADAFDAMTTRRSYRQEISVEAALAELREQAGRQFDPFAVEALETFLAGGGPLTGVAHEVGVTTWSS